MSDENDAACACVGYTIRTDYGTGIEYDVDRSSCPIHDDMEYEADPRDCCDRCGGATRHRGTCVTASADGGA